MDTNKILSADFIDLLFDNRNKEYGAYELRKTYQTRLTKALIFAGILVGLAFTGVVFANKLEPKQKSMFVIRELSVEDLKFDEKEPEVIPEPPRKPEPVQVQTAQFTQLRVVVDEEPPDPLATQEDLAISIISDENRVGVIDERFVRTDNIDGDKNIIEEKEIKEQEIATSVDIDAKFDGNWEKFLVRNLNPQTPIDNNAPAGNYTVIIQFVVDIDGTVSDIKALSNLGFGLEQEATRVLKKATKWEPAIQNGRKVKAYRKQAITFQVTEE